MYGRILLVGSAILGEADYQHRLAEAFRRGGHAVLTLKVSKERRVFLQELGAALKYFEPTLVLWGKDVAYDEELDGMVRGVACASLPCQPVCDALYANTIPSEPSAVREGLGCAQTCSDERSLCLESAVGAACGDRFIATHSSWPQSLSKAFPYGNAAYYLRTVKYFVAFAGEDAPSETELALRVAEGSLVLVEEALLRSFVERNGSSSISSALVPFERGQLAACIEGFEEDSEAFEKARSRQLSVYEALLPVEAFGDMFLANQDAKRKAAGLSPVLAYAEPATRVTLCGWFGARNFGDDLLMLNAAHRIRQRYPNAQIMVIGARPGIIRRDYGLEAVEPYDRPGLKRVLAGSLALVFCGGLIFDDPLATTSGDLEFLNNPWIEPTGQAGMSLYAASLGVPSVGLGIGAGPVRNEATRRAIRLMGLARMRFLPRDAQTCEWFRLSGVDPALISQKADLILGARSLVDEMASKAALPRMCTSGGYFVVSLRKWHLSPPDFVANVAKALERVCEATGLNAVLLPFGDEDIAIHEEVIRSIEQAGRVEILRNRPSEEEILAIISGSEFAFAMRLHCSILHHVLGKSAVGLDYNDKIAAHFQLMGQDDLLIPLAASPEAMEQAMLAAYNKLGCAGETLAKAVDAKATLVDEAFDELFAMIDAPTSEAAGVNMFDAEPGLSVSYPRTASKEHIKRAKLESELKASKAECEKLRKQVKKQEAQLNSRTYRVAKKASKTLRPLRKLFK